MKHELQAVLDN